MHHEKSCCWATLGVAQVVVLLDVDNHRHLVDSGAECLDIVPWETGAYYTWQRSCNAARDVDGSAVERDLI